MAILMPDELAELRRRIRRKMAGQAIDFDKATVNTALQATEDWFQANKVAISAAIDAATTPYTFSVQHKKWIVAYWLMARALGEGA